jgi:hypothetical protein
MMQSGSSFSAGRLQGEPTLTGLSIVHRFGSSQLKVALNSHTQSNVPFVHISSRLRGKSGLDSGLWKAMVNCAIAHIPGSERAQILLLPHRITITSDY